MSYEWLSYSIPLNVPISGFRFHCAVLSRLVTTCITTLLKESVFPLSENFGQNPKDGKITTYLMISSRVSPVIPIG